jgi:hypothetical protein
MFVGSHQLKNAFPGYLNSFLIHFEILVTAVFHKVIAFNVFIDIA